MSRIGNKPIIIDPTVKITVDGDEVCVEGTGGKIVLPVSSGVKVEVNDKEILFKTKSSSDNNQQGLFRTLVQNAVTGVKNPWTKNLELIGVGYRAQTQGEDLILNVGFTHQVTIKAPAGISFKVAENKITVTGADKYLVGEVAASIRRVKPPEPYKGKGIRYQGEYIRKKLGKAAKAVGGATGAK
jgi:large subunit ribosomal protein L6